MCSTTTDFLQPALRRAHSSATTREKTTRYDLRVWQPPLKNQADRHNKKKKNFDVTRKDPTTITRNHQSPS
jgi:hypothetical protein